MPSLPPITKFDQIIVNFDPYKISSSIQSIISYRDDCQEKIRYLEQLIPRIQEHIDFNKHLFRQEEQRIKFSQGQFQQLEIEKARIEAQIVEYSQVDEIKKDLDWLEG